MKLRKAISVANIGLKERREPHIVVRLGGEVYDVVANGAYDGDKDIHHVAVAPDDTVSISGGNRKTGDEVPSISLHPDVTCSGKGRLCHTRGLKGVPIKNQPPRCYALCNMADFRKTISDAWNRNCKILDKSRDMFFWQSEAYLNKKQPRWFRWFVGGGCPDQDFFDRTVRLARRTDQTKFVMFEKGYDMGLDYGYAPGNMEVILSTWPGMPLPGKEYDGFQWSWLDVDPRYPHEALKCSGHCSTCGLCWNLSKVKRDVLLHVH